MGIKQYSTIASDHFPQYYFAGFTDDTGGLEILKSTQAQMCVYEKVTWSIANTEGVMEDNGLRYGENPKQEAALYKPINGHLILAGIKFLGEGDALTGGISSDALLQFGKHPSKTNLTDIDNALSILKYFHTEPCAIIVKHNNPCGVALGDSLLSAYTKAFEADPIAPFGGVLAVNQELDKNTAEAISREYYEVVCAPSYAEGAFDILAKRKNLRIVELKDIAKLHNYIGQHFLDSKCLMDGSVVHQWSYIPTAGKDQEVIRSFDDFKRLVVVPNDVAERGMEGGKLIKTGRSVSINRTPTDAEMKDLWFAWMVETGVTSNSVLTAKDLATVSIGAGGQDRVMMAKQCVNKAYESRRALLAKKRFGLNFDALELEVKTGKHDASVLNEITEEAKEGNANLQNAVAASDAFFPFRDGADALLSQGIKAIVQPGDSLRDSEVIDACNENNATMVFTGMRCFKH